MSDTVERLRFLHDEFVAGRDRRYGEVVETAASAADELESLRWLAEEVVAASENLADEFDRSNRLSLLAERAAKVLWGT